MTRKTLHRIRLVLMLTAALSIGLHFAVIQMVGWVSMTVEYSQKAPLSEALRMTFDGKHPCEICKLVEKEMGQSDPDQNRTPDPKSELKLPPVICWLDEIRLIPRPHLFLDIAMADARARPRRERPPLLPPREMMIHVS